MDPLEAIGGAQATSLVDENGDEVQFELAPALAPADIAGSAPLGVGFSWGRSGPRAGVSDDTDTSGCSRNAPPEKTPGLLRRLFA
jgi:hypothetical protein